jgi:hypothetical protein
MLDKQKIFELINEWEQEAGESFTDYFSGHVNASSFIMWALGRRYITPQQFNLWEDALTKRELEATCFNYYLYSHYGDKVPFACVEEEDWTEEGQDKAYMIFAEFVSESKIYQKRLTEFLKDYFDPRVAQMQNKGVLQ